MRIRTRHTDKAEVDEEDQEDGDVEGVSQFTVADFCIVIVLSRSKY